MSRGYGHIQRFVLAELDDQCVIDERWLQARTLAIRLEGRDATDASISSVRRALRLLAADGLVDLAARGVAAPDIADPDADSAGNRRLLARIPPALRHESAVRRARRERTAAYREQLAQRLAPAGPGRSESLRPGRSRSLAGTGAASVWIT